MKFIWILLLIESVFISWIVGYCQWIVVKQHKVCFGVTDLISSCITVHPLTTHSHPTRVNRAFAIDLCQNFIPDLYLFMWITQQYSLRVFSVGVVPQQDNYIYKSSTKRDISIEEKTFCFSHNDRNNQKKLDKYHFIYIYVCLHTPTPHIFIYIYTCISRIFYIYTHIHIYKTWCVYIYNKYSNSLIHLWELAKNKK